MKIRINSIRRICFGTYSYMVEGDYKSRKIKFKKDKFEFEGKVYDRFFNDDPDPRTERVYIELGSVKGLELVY